MTIRRLQRAVALALALAVCIFRYWLSRLHGPMTLERRALWMQEASRRVMASLEINCRVEGLPPACGLVVANHLSYLDIVIISAATPCFFVAKAEIGRWPYFGRAARNGGTLFLDRSSLASARRVADQIAERLRLPIPVLLFPEGTSTDGSRVLRFHARLIEPATAMGAPVSAAAVRYFVEDGNGNLPERELCWFGDDGFLSHLWKVLGVRRFSAILRFGPPKIYCDCRDAASRTHAEVTAMREEGALVAFESFLAAHSRREILQRLRASPAAIEFSAGAAPKSDARQCRPTQIHGRD